MKIKDIFLGIFCSLLIFLMVFMMVEAYGKERCGRVLSQLQDKKENPFLFPGLELTKETEWACPGIKQELQK